MMTYCSTSAYLMVHSRASTYARIRCGVTTVTLIPYAIINAPK